MSEFIIIIYFHKHYLCIHSRFNKLIEKIRTHRWMPPSCESINLCCSINLAEGSKKR